MKDRFRERARAWGVAVEHAFETETSVIGFGLRDRQAVVLKVLKRQGDEWTSGEVVRAFQGHGVVRVHEYLDGAMLLERLMPGHSLVGTALDGRDSEAIDILADVVRRMSARTPPASCATVHDWAKGFERYPASGDDSIPRDLVLDSGHWSQVQSHNFCYYSIHRNAPRDQSLNGPRALAFGVYALN